MIYLASPYSHARPEVMEMRYELACDAAAWLMIEGHHVYSPIAHGHSLSQARDLPMAHRFWLPLCLDMIRRCDLVAVLTIEGWRSSYGILRELAFARGRHMPELAMVPAPSVGSVAAQPYILIQPTGGRVDMDTRTLPEII